MHYNKSSLYVGFFLAVRDIKRGNKWTTALIVFVMTLTFFNMILLNGILSGLASGFADSYRQYYSGDIFITPATEKNDIEQTGTILTTIRTLPSFSLVSERYTDQATVEYNYQNKLRATDLPESATTTLTGIDPIAEDTISHLSKSIIAGTYLQPGDANGIIVGSALMQAYLTGKDATANTGSRILKTAKVGSRVLITVNGVQKDVIIKGVFNTNNTIVDNRIYMNIVTARELMKRDSLNANEIAVVLKPGASDIDAKQFLLKNISNDSDIVIQTAKEALPNSVIEIFQTFDVLANLVGAIALIVAAITIFIVIFVNAITRKKFIGILKGIGISSFAIEASYIFQSLFYASSGILIGSIIILGFIKPYFAVHPINFPITQGQFDVTVWDLVFRAIILLVTALLSGYIPAWSVTKQNTLNTILGR